jgi:biopolymer transport protein ExbB
LKRWGINSNEKPIPMSAWQLFLSGGPLMWPIVGCAILSCAIALERFFYFQQAENGSREMIRTVLDHVKRNQIKEAVRSCEGCRSPVVRLLKAGILKYDRPRTQIKESLEDASLYEIPLLEKNLLFLSTIAHIAPLLGLLGTVTAMISCFYAVYHAQISAGAISAADFSAGIWQGLITTGAGLAVAITSFIAYNYLLSRMNRLIIEMDQSSAELLNTLSE